MLIKFFVENFLSFDTEISLNMIATSKKEHQNHIIETDKNIKLLCTAALYGANASGKSNLIKAVSFAKEFILNGTKPDQLIQQNFFKLKKDANTKPSKFEFIIYIDSSIFHYGFSFDKQRIHEEWLYVKENVKYLKYFERIVNPDGNSKYEFGPSLVKKSEKNDYKFYKFVMQGTRPNQLFLTEAILRNIKKLKPLYNWFGDTLNIIPADSQYALLTVRAKEDKKFGEFLETILKKISKDIHKIKTTEIELDLDKQFPDMPTEMQRDILSSVDKDSAVIVSDEGKQYTITQNDKENLILVKLKTCHKIKESEETIDFELDEESDGTQRFIHLAPALVNMVSNDIVLFIDELDRRLHPLLSRSFLKIFLKSPRTKSQMIFTTHESNLLNANLLRRDEIWFTEKDDFGASHLTSLDEFKVRDDLNLEKGYLNGRFGAIPFLGDLDLISIDSPQTHGIV